MMNLGTVLSFCCMVGACIGFSMPGSSISPPRAFQMRKTTYATYSSYDPSTINGSIGRIYSTGSTALFESESSNKEEPTLETAKEPTTPVLKQELTLEESLAKVVENTKSGEVGNRGEYFFAGQALILLFIVYGQIPFWSEDISHSLGILFSFIGVTTAGLGVKDLGITNLSPWPTPMKSSMLVKDGIYAQIRHPMYAGLIWVSLGLSIYTESATRLFLSFVLWWLLDKKATYEERCLRDKFEDYQEYEKEVDRMFVFDELVQISLGLKESFAAIVGGI